MKKRFGGLVVFILALLVALVFLTTGCTKPAELPTPAPGQENNAGVAVNNGNDEVNIDLDEEQEEFVPNDSAVTEGKGPTPFSLEDCYVLGVSLGMPEETVLTILGEPEETTIDFNAALHGNIKILHYPFGTLRFWEDELLSFEVNTTGADGPRGIQVGDSMESVIDKFPYEEKPVEGDNPRYATKPLYGVMAHHETGGGIYYEAYEIIYGDGEHGVALRVEIEDGSVSRFRCFFAVT